MSSIKSSRLDKSIVFMRFSSVLQTLSPRVQNCMLIFCKDHRDKIELPDPLAVAFLFFCPTDRPTFTRGRAMGNETFYWDGIISGKLNNKRKLARLITQYRDIFVCAGQWSRELVLRFLSTVFSLALLSHHKPGAVRNFSKTPPFFRGLLWCPGCWLQHEP